VGLTIPSGALPSTVGVYDDRSHPCRAPFPAQLEARQPRRFRQSDLREGLEVVVDAIDREASPGRYRASRCPRSAASRVPEPFPGLATLSYHVALQRGGQDGAEPGLYRSTIRR